MHSRLAGRRCRRKTSFATSAFPGSSHMAWPRTNHGAQCPTIFGQPGSKSPVTPLCLKTLRHRSYRSKSRSVTLFSCSELSTVTLFEVPSSASAQPTASTWRPTARFLLTLSLSVFRTCRPSSSSNNNKSSLKSRCSNRNRRNATFCSRFHLRLMASSPVSGFTREMIWRTWFVSSATLRASALLSMAHSFAVLSLTPALP
mmetsp:Transcript_8798/g.17404  ORF Transcript_8798/g.17404 Transcript_8798/m.17404 type:complete len:201 (-) Transcript_8798:363-965(-)